MARAVERRALRRVHEVIVVNESIADHYRRTYGLTNVSVVRNVQARRGVVLEPAHDLRNELGISAQAVIFVYQGLIARARGVELLIDAFARLDHERHHLVLLGHGSEVPALRERARGVGNIHFKDSVPPAELLRTLRGADVGLCVIEDLCLSYRYCLPNKLFECFTAGLPVIVTDLPELRATVERYRAGWIVRYDLDALVSRIGTLDRASVAAVAEGLRERTEECSWEHEEERLVAVYERLLGPRDV
jgi:glycosyltransferase involved in cell wall biosynthesis